MEKYYPTWVLEESHPLTQAAVSTYQALWNREPVVDKWTFSTNGVGSMGLMGVPTIGFGPGEEDVAHSVAERVPIRHLVEAAQFYAAFPLTYLATLKKAQWLNWFHCRCRCCCGGRSTNTGTKARSSTCRRANSFGAFRVWTFRSSFTGIARPRRWDRRRGRTGNWRRTSRSPGWAARASSS